MEAPNPTIAGPSDIAQFMTQHIHPLVPTFRIPTVMPIPDPTLRTPSLDLMKSSQARFYTGGPLNTLKDRYNLNRRDKTVAASELVRWHKPTSDEEVRELIASHRQPGCACGVKSKGTIDDFAKALYEKQFQDPQWFTESKLNSVFSYDLCERYCFELFCCSTRAGIDMEYRAMRQLNDYFETDNIPLACVMGSAEDDTKYAVDLVVVGREQHVICGVQVKSKSFEKKRGRDFLLNLEKNGKYGRPVFYISYNPGDLSWNNFEELTRQICRVADGNCRASIEDLQPPVQDEEIDRYYAAQEPCHIMI